MEKLHGPTRFHQEEWAPVATPGHAELEQEVLRRQAAEPVTGDGWENPLMGYGTWRDKLTAGHYAGSIRLDDQQLSDLFYTNDLAAKVVEKRASEAFRRGYKIENYDATDLIKKAKALGANEKLQEAMTWGRLFGGCLAILGIEGGAPWTPLQLEKVRDVKYINVVDRRDIRVEKRYSDPLAPNYGDPEVYGILGLSGMTSFVHESRCIRFDGVMADKRKRYELDGWSYSVLQRPYDVMRMFETAFQSAGVLTADASQAVFKIKGLFEMITSGEKKNLQTRMQLVDMSRSALRAILLDADGENFERIATQFNGLPEMLDRFAMRFAASIDMPVTLLMGRSPAGENATGDSDFVHWYDSVASEQKKYLSPKVDYLYKVLSAGAFDGEICWLPLKELTEADRANIDKTVAETGKTLTDAGILYPQEYAIAHYSKDPTGVVVVDETKRKAELSSEQELTLNPPPPPTMMPPGAPGAGGPGPGKPPPPATPAVPPTKAAA